MIFCRIDCYNSYPWMKTIWTFIIKFIKSYRYILCLISVYPGREETLDCKLHTFIEFWLIYSKISNEHFNKYRKGVTALFIIVGNVYKFILNCLIPWDPWIYPYRTYIWFCSLCPVSLFSQPYPIIFNRGIPPPPINHLVYRMFSWRKGTMGCLLH